MAREQRQGLLTAGAAHESNIVSALVETVTRLVVQELLEGEQQDFLGGRGRCDRRDAEQAGSRNGYERGRLRTAEGFVDVAVPQVRGAGGPFRSSLMGFLDGNSELLESLVNEMYARGLSTRDVEDAFRDATGELLIPRSAVSEITDRLWEDYQTFISCDLSGLEVEYLFVDAVFESLRRRSLPARWPDAGLSRGRGSASRRRGSGRSSSRPRAPGPRAGPTVAADRFTQILPGHVEVSRSREIPRRTRTR